jgi:hypothetical protein
MLFFGIILSMTTAQFLNPEQLKNENADLRCKVVYLEEQLA